MLGVGENRARRIGALLALGGALLCLPWAQHREFFYAGYVSMVVAGVLLTPFLSLTLSKLLRFPMKRIRRVEGLLAADSLIQAPRQTSTAVAALSLSIALAIGTGGVARSSHQTIENWAIDTLNPDLFVSTSETIVGNDFRFPASLQGELERVQGVDEVEAVRRPRISFNGQPAMLLVTEFEKLGKRVHRTAVAGDAASMDRLVGEEKSFMISESLANLQNIRLGQTWQSCPRPAALCACPWLESSRISPTSWAASSWTVRPTSVIPRRHCRFLPRLYQPGVSPAEVRKTINDQVGGQRRLFVLLNQNVRDYVMGVTSQWFDMTYLRYLLPSLLPFWAS